MYNLNKMARSLAVGIGMLLIALSLPWGSYADSPALVVSNELKLKFNVSEPSENDAGDIPNTTETVEQITIVVDGGHANDEVYSTVVIQRTTKADGAIIDEVVFSADKAEETVDKASREGQDTARIMIPDDKDEVSELNVRIPRETLQKLADGHLNLEIFTSHVRIMLPTSSMIGIDEDFYFRLIPVKTESLRMEVEERAKKEEMVREALGDGHIEVVARPMTIETNLSSRPVELILPLQGVELPTDPQELADFLADLAIFVEHSDGERALIQPEPVTYEDGLLGLKFSITKFSTFTILNMENWSADLEGKADNLHESYLSGYPDQTFRPERSISRAEMAALLSRIVADASSDSAVPDYSDVNMNHWAYGSMMKVSHTGLMKGYPDGSFAPERAVTRAEMAVIVSSWLSLSENAVDTSTTGLTDIQRHWAEKQIKLAEQAGILTGMPDSTFQPDRPLTRAEAVTILNRILHRGPLHGVATSPWKDVSKNHWAFGDIAEASMTHEFTMVSGAEILLIQ